MRPASNHELTEVGRREGEGKNLFDQLDAMTPEGFPLPELLHYGFTRLLGVQCYGPFEKMRWGYRFDFKGGTYGMEYRKFGLRFLCEPRNLDSPVLREVMGRARELTNIVEKYLSSGPIEQQINAGNITIDNLYNSLRARYDFFRERAGIAFKQTPSSTKGDGFTLNADFWRSKIEGGTLGTAAVDAYFSATEHLFCIALAFSISEQTSPPLLEFLAANWPTKARLVLDLTDSRIKASYDHLLRVREEWRNPIAHGGFMSKGASLFVHVPGVGALPAKLRRTADGVKVGLRLSDESFSQIMCAFNEFDEILGSSHLRFALKWAQSGLSVAYDAHSLRNYRVAMSSDAAFEEFIDYSSYEQDRHANMDY